MKKKLGITKYNINVSAPHPLAELLARKLSGIETVPKKEQSRIVHVAIKAAVKWHEENNHEDQYHFPEQHLRSCFLG